MLKESLQQTDRIYVTSYTKLRVCDFVMGDCNAHLARIFALLCRFDDVRDHVGVHMEKKSASILNGRRRVAYGNCRKVLGADRILWSTTRTKLLPEVL